MPKPPVKHPDLRKAITQRLAARLRMTPAEVEETALSSLVLILDDSPENAPIRAAFERLVHARDTRNQQPAEGQPAQ